MKAARPDYQRDGRRRRAGPWRHRISKDLPAVGSRAREGKIFSAVLAYMERPLPRQTTVRPKPHGRQRFPGSQDQRPLRTSSIPPAPGDVPLRDVRPRAAFKSVQVTLVATP
jgi:hypothetical protein